MAEIIISHDKIRDPQSITDVMEREFKAKDMDIHQHEVTHLEDDHKRGVRKITVKNTKYFTVGDVPWRK
jgi:hypothetical protein